MLRKLLRAGADVFRLNMSHARHDWCREICARIREASAEVGRAVGILFDLQGPSIRTGDVEEKSSSNPAISLNSGTGGPRPGSRNRPP
jgi:pyruvate kinase